MIATLKSHLGGRGHGAPHAPSLAVDFDGRIAELRDDLDLTKTRPREGCRAALGKLRAAGVRVLIWTGRPDKDAVEAWLGRNGIGYDAFNANPDYETGSRKMVADMYLDDRGEGDPDAPWDELFEEVVARLFGDDEQPVSKHDGYAELMALAGPARGELTAMLGDVLGLPVMETGDLALGEFEERVRQPGGLIVVPPLKTEKRSREKVEADYDGDWRKLLDVVRASVAVDSLPEVYRAVQQVLASGQVRLARFPKDRFREPLANGYRDLLCNYRLPSDPIVEVQYHIKPMLIARERERLAYDVVRAIKASMAEEGRDDMTPAEAEACRRARKDSERIFARAWDECQARSSPQTKGLRSQLKDDRWVTLDPSGTHVMIDDSGLDRGLRVKDTSRSLGAGVLGEALRRPVMAKGCELPSCFGGPEKCLGVAKQLRSDL